MDSRGPNDFMQREIPPKFKELLVVHHVFKPGFLTRLKFLIGYNVKVYLQIATEHRVGRTDKRIRVEPTLLVTSPIATQKEIEDAFGTVCEPQTNETENQKV
jgi:hypothetical protein